MTRVRRSAERPSALGRGPEIKGFRVSGRLWIERDDDTYLSWGRVVLLERIREHGSISAAARSMAMGYRHAWQLVDSLNELAPQPLVEKTTGGKRGGGAKLTPAGETAIAEFWGLVGAFEAWLSTQTLPTSESQ